MRSPDNIKKIQENWELTKELVIIDDFLSEQEMNILLNFRDTLTSNNIPNLNEENKTEVSINDCLKIYNWNNNDLDSLPNEIYKRIRQVLPITEVGRNLQFLKLCKPFGLHTDLGRNPNIIPSRTLVLSLDKHDSGGIALFKQYGIDSLSWSQSYKKNPNVILTSENKPNYIIDFDPKKTVNDIDPKIRSGILRHLKDEHFHGLEFESYIPYKFNRALIFNPCRVHCSAWPETETFNEKNILSLFCHHKDIK